MKCGDLRQQPFAANGPEVEADDPPQHKAQGQGGGQGQADVHQEPREFLLLDPGIQRLLECRSGLLGDLVEVLT